MRPRPSDDPVINTRATSHLLSSRRPFRLTIPNGFPALRVFPCPRHDASARVYTIREEEGRPGEQHLRHWFRAEAISFNRYWSVLDEHDPAWLEHIYSDISPRMV